MQGEKQRYSKTDVARWMNRPGGGQRLLDEQGTDRQRAGGIAEAIECAAKPTGAMSKDCCDEILKRLDRLDEIAKMLRDMADQNAGCGAKSTI